MCDADVLRAVRGAPGLLPTDGVAGELAGPAPVPGLALKMSPWCWKGLPLADKMILPFCVASAPSNPA